MHPDDPLKKYATPDDVCAAVGALSKEDHYRIYKAATLCIWGTEYQDPKELINEAVARTLAGASGQRGRRWPHHVPFIAYMIMTIQGLANDSHESSVQKLTDSLDGMALHDESTGEILGGLQYYQEGIETQVIEAEEVNSREARAKEFVRIIDTHFAGDSQITWIIMGHKDDLSASEIREISGMTQRQYETARTRFRRGLAKLFPEKRKA